MTFKFEEEDENKYIKMLSRCLKENITPNYFSRYALIENIEDPFSLPRTDIDNSDIEIAISRVTSFWNKNKTNSKYTRTIEKFLSENDKAKDVLRDEKKRKLERKAVIDEIDKQVRETYKLLDGMLEDLVSKRPARRLTPEEPELLYKEFPNFSKDNIDKRLREKQISIIHKREFLYPMLEDSTIKNISKELKVFGYDNLFEFLSVSKENYSSSKIKEQYSKLQAEWNKKPINPEKTAAQALLGYVNTYLIHTDINKYINSLLFESISELLDLNQLIKSKKVSRDKLLDEEKLKDLVSKAKNKGIKEEFARDSILYIAEKNGIYYIPPLSFKTGIDNSINNIKEAPTKEIPIKEKPIKEKPIKEKPTTKISKKNLFFGAILFLLIFGNWNIFHDNDETSQEVKEENLNTLEEKPLASEYSNPLNSHTSTIEEDELPEAYTNSIGMEFVKIPAGEFMMGSPEDEEGKDDDVDPANKVMIEEPYYLGKYEVTQKQWRKVMGDNPSYFQGSTLPVEQVSWYDAQEFVKKLNQIEDTDKYRLPSEAEWEYACCAGNSTKYSFGDDESQLYAYAWYNRNSVRKSHPVGQKKPNSWGLYDMHGNVWEWVAWHDVYTNTDSSSSDMEQNGNSIARGGGWSSNSQLCLSTVNYSFKPDSHNYNLGFRVLKEI